MKHTRQPTLLIATVILAATCGVSIVGGLQNITGTRSWVSIGAGGISVYFGIALAYVIVQLKGLMAE